MIDQISRSTLTAELNKSRALLKRKRASHRRYLVLRRDKRKLTREMRAEFKSLLYEFRTLGAAMKDASAFINGALDTRERQTAAFLRGHELGLEHAQALAKQTELDTLTRKEKML